MLLYITNETNNPVDIVEIDYTLAPDEEINLNDYYHIFSDAWRALMVMETTDLYQARIEGKISYRVIEEVNNHPWER